MNTNNEYLINNQLNNSEDQGQYITFSIDQEEYGLEILKVQEIIGFVEPAHVPNTPDFIRGVINLRGIIIPVIDLRKLFGLPEKTYDKYTVVIVLQVGSKTMGIIVDAVSDVLSLKEDEFQDIPEISKINSEFIKGMGKIDNRLIILVDIEKMFNSNKDLELAISERNNF